MSVPALARSPQFDRRTGAASERPSKSLPDSIASDQSTLEILAPPEQGSPAASPNDDPANQSLILRDDALTPAAIVNTKLEKPALARFEIVESLISFLARSGLAQKVGARQFALMLEARFCEGFSQSTREYLAAHPPSGPTILRWLRKSSKGLAALASRHRGSTSEINRNPELKAELAGQLVRPRAKSLSAAILAKVINAVKGSDLSRRQVLRARRRIEIANRADLAAVTNPDRFRSRYAVRLGDSNEAYSGFCEAGLVDGTPSNCLTLSGRAHITIMQCPFSRLAVAVVSRAEDGLSICRLIAKFSERLALPGLAFTDNGPGERSRRTAYFAKALGIKLKFAQKFTPEQKADIESMVRNLCQVLLPQLPGFAGASVAARQELRGYFSMSARQGKDDRDLLGVKLTNEELEMEIDRYLERVYPYAHHEGLGMTPARKLQDWIEAGGIAKKISPDQQSALHALLLVDGVVRTIGPEGIRLDNLNYWDHAFAAGNWINKQALVARSADPSRIVVYSESEPRRLIAIAESMAHFSGESLRSLAIEAKIVQKGRKKRLRAGARRLRDNSCEDIFGAQLKTAPAGLPAIPSTEHSTPAIEAGARAAAALAERPVKSRPLLESNLAEDERFDKLGKAADRRDEKLSNSKF